MRANVELTRAEQGAEAELLRYYATGDPDPAFIERLENHLRNQVSAMPAKLARNPVPGARHSRPLRWSAVALALFLVLAATVAAVGPQRVWAQVQQLFGYVPGIGFVDLAETRVLPAPVEVTRDGVTLRVEQVVAEPDRTRLVVRSFGLPSGDSVFLGGGNMGQRMLDFAGRLRLPDDSTLDFKGLFLQYGEGASTLEFAALPPGVMQFVLELDRLPLVPPGRAPEGWRIPLTLVPANADGVGENFPAPYRPNGASDTHRGVTLTVEHVAHTADETAIKLRGTWSDSDLGIYSLIGGMANPTLFDNVGHVYGFKSSPGSGSSVAVVEKVVVAPEGGPLPTAMPLSREEEFSVEALSTFAREVTLQVDALQADVPVEAQRITVVIPKGAQVGTRWPLDINLTIAGFPVRITGAALETERLMFNGKMRNRTLLTLAVAPIPEIDGRRLTYFSLQPEAGPGWEPGSGSSSGPEGGMTVSLAFDSDAALPSGPVTAKVRGASILLLGPWRMTWPVPGRTGQVAVPATLLPEARDAHDGLTLAIREVVHTDRLTHVLVDLENAPPGVKLAQAQVMWVDDRVRGDQLGFEDDRGRRYEPDRAHIRWLRRGATYSPTWEPTAPGPQTLRLPPVDPLARRFTLTLPTIEVIRPISGSFTVTVPAEVTMKDIPGAPSIQTSEPWPVDVMLDAGGKTVRYTEATLNTQRSALWVVLAPETGNAPGAAGVSGLCGLTMTGPDGRPVRNAQGNFMFAPGPCAVMPGFAASDESGRLIPGEYRVSFEGIAVRVAGPWRLSWERGGLLP